MEYSKEDAETLENIRTRVCQLECVVSEMKRDKADMGAIKLLEMSIANLTEKVIAFMERQAKKENEEKKEKEDAIKETKKDKINWLNITLVVCGLIIAAGQLMLAFKK